MKTLNYILTLLLTLGLTAEAQYNRQKEFESHYGINFSQINSGSGHGSGYSLNTNIQKGRKSLEAGLIYQTRENRIAGADFRYKIFLGKFDESIYRFKVIRPYLQYNLIYHKATVDEPIVIKTETLFTQIPSSGAGKIATIEHYAAFGMQFKVMNGIYLDASFGLGTYFGSISKIEKPHTIGIHKYNHGFTGSFKIGLGYRIS